MVSRLLLVYAVVELAVIFALVSTIGWGWTLLVLLATFLLGWGLLVPLAGSHALHQIGQLRSGLTEPRAAVSDGALVTLATGPGPGSRAGHHGVGAVAAGAAGPVCRRPRFGRDRDARSAAAGAADQLRDRFRPSPVVAMRATAATTSTARSSTSRDFDSPALPNDPVGGGSRATGIRRRLP